MVRAIVRPRHRRVLVMTLALLVGTVGSLSLVGTLSAQGAQQSCRGDIVVSAGGETLFGGTAGRLYANTNLPGWVTSRTYALGQTVPAGTYTVMAVSYDGYVGRENVFQANEVWFAEFGGGGGVLATTGTTGDVPDGLSEAFWSGEVGTVTLAADATQLTVRHGFLTNDVPNSVEPVCLGLTLQTPTPPSTTEAATTTVVATTIVNTTTTAPTTTSESPPDSVQPPPPPSIPPPTEPQPPGPPPAPTSPPPATVAPEGTDAPETQVLGAVEEAGVATAVGGNPSFTG